jgi:hypothetical protein
MVTTQTGERERCQSQRAEMPYATIEPTIKTAKRVAMTFWRRFSIDHLSFLNLLSVSEVTGFFVDLARE